MRAVAVAAVSAAVALPLSAGLAGLPISGSPVTARATTAQTETARAAAAPAACQAGTTVWIAQRPTALNQLQTDLAWPRTRGGGITVAVIDSGVDAGNEHLTGAMAGGIDLVGDGAGANGLADPLGHGTAVAGIIAARRLTDHDSGLVGLAPEARILSVRVYRDLGDDSAKSGFGLRADRLAAGIDYAADADAAVIAVPIALEEDSALVAAAVARATARGSLVVASAGTAPDGESNSGERYPAGDAGAIGVTALAGDDTPVDDQVRGPHVGLAAPGVDVLTAQTGGGDCVKASASGADASASADYATAYVSAAAALVAAAHPGEGPEKWAYRLEASALRDRADTRDDRAGWGAVQPYDAIALSPGPGIRGPASPFADVSDAAPVVRRPEVAPDHAAPPIVAARHAIVVAGVGGATLLGTALVIAVAVRRRGAASRAEEGSSSRRRSEGRGDPPQDP